MRFEFLSSDESVIRTMAKTADPQLSAAVQEPALVRGAADSWWELAVDVGAIGLPMGILGNLIATWISDALKQAKARSAAAHRSELKMVITHSGAPIEIDINSTDVEQIRIAVEHALKHVDQQ